MKGVIDHLRRQGFDQGVEWARDALWDMRDRTLEDIYQDPVVIAWARLTDKVWAPRNQAIHERSMQRACPRCGAGPGDACVTKTGKRASIMHSPRWSV